MTDRELRDHFWHPICHRSEVPGPGDFVRLTWLDEEVVAWNDGGNVIVFDNVCPHRGARYLSASCGNSPLTCRYHGWSYRGGKLWIPRKETFDPDEIARVRLNTLQSAWCGDFLFGAIAPKMPLNVQLEGVTDLLESMSRSITKRVDMDTYAYECDWRVAMENALEPYHIDLVHDDTLKSLKLDAGSNDLFAFTSVWYAKIQDERTVKRLKAMRRFFNLTYQFEGYASVYFFPFSMISSTFGYSYSMQNFFPGCRSNETSFTSRLLTSAPGSPEAVEVLEPFFAATAEFNRRVFREDHEICKRVKPGHWDLARLMPLAQSEAKVAHFRHLYRECQ